MKNIYTDFKFKRHWIYGVFIILLGIVSCQNLEEFTLNTIPSPQNARITKVDRNATLAWDAVSDPRVDSYEIQLGSDSEFSVVLKTDTIPSNLLEYTFEDLESEESYAARVRALNPDPLTNSFYASVVFISNEIENIFRLMTDEHIGIGWVNLRWNEPEEGSVTHIILTPTEGGNEIRADLTPEQIANRSARIENLDRNGANYFAEIFDNNILRGETIFTSLDVNASITINDDNTNYRSLQDAINAARSADIINIGNTVYDFSDMGEVQVENKSLTIRGMSEGDIPELTVHIFNLVGSVPYFKLENLKIIGRSQQIIRFENIVGSSDISITDCDISGASAGLIYASSGSTATIGFEMENSILHDFGNQGGDFIDYRNGAISKFLVKNSTFYNLARDFIRIDGPVQNVGENLRFENCTFDNITSNRFIYIRSNTSKTDFVRCLLTNKASNGQNGILTEVTFTDSNVFGTFSERYAQHTMTVENMTALDPQYENAGAGNYKVNNPEVINARQGDTRWLE